MVHLAWILLICMGALGLWAFQSLRKRRVISFTPCGAPWQDVLCMRRKGHKDPWHQNGWINWRDPR